MKRAWIVLGIVVALSVLIWGAWFILLLSKAQPVGKCDAQQPWPCGMSAVGNKEIWITTPGKENALVSSPLKVTGSAIGTWYFEASFPVTITDWDGKIIGVSHIQALGEWMTTQMVPFEGTIEFTPPPCSAEYCHRGTLIFRNDNPSGDPARQKSFEVPVIFK